jgi:hypothetical protein
MGRLRDTICCADHSEKHALRLKFDADIGRKLGDPNAGPDWSTAAIMRFITISRWQTEVGDLEVLVGGMRDVAQQNGARRSRCLFDRDKSSRP